MTIHRYSFLAAGVLLACVALVRVKSPAARTTIAIAVWDESGGALEAAAQKFREDARNSGIQVQLREFGYDELYDEVTVRGGRTYDVVMVDHPWLTLLRDKLRALTIQEPEQVPRNVLNAVRCPHPTATCVVGVPYVGNTELFVINRRVLRDAKWPQTWDEVVTLASGVTKGGVYGYAARGRFDDDSSVTDEFMPVYWWAQERGGDTLTAVTKASNILASLASKGPPFLGLLDDYEIAALLLNGKIAMGMTWSNWAMRMADADPAAARELKFGLPPGDAPEMGIWALAIPLDARHPREAQRFIEYATKCEVLKGAAMAGNPPLRKDLLRDAKLRTRYPSFDSQLLSLEKAKERPPEQKWHECSEKKIAESLRELYFGELAATKATQQIKDALAANEACRLQRFEH